MSSAASDSGAAAGSPAAAAGVKRPRSPTARLRFSLSGDERGSGDEAPGSEADRGVATTAMPVPRSRTKRFRLDLPPRPPGPAVKVTVVLYGQRHVGYLPRLGAAAAAAAAADTGGSAAGSGYMSSAEEEEEEEEESEGAAHVQPVAVTAATAVPTAPTAAAVARREAAGEEMDVDPASPDRDSDAGGGSSGGAVDDG
ncbi:MAG: hypothetical protein ACK4ZJ_18920, partial [Allorhizobium sp.]